MNEYFEYLTDLRDGGTMNMMWGPTMLQSRFDLSVKESREVFQKWCESLAESQPTRAAQRTTPSGGRVKSGPPRFSRTPNRRGFLKYFDFFLVLCSRAIDICADVCYNGDIQVNQSKGLHHGFYLERKQPYRNPRHRCGVFSGIVPMAGGLSRSAREGFN